jgi:hypothetical protein
VLLGAVLPVQHADGDLSSKRLPSSTAMQASEDVISNTTAGALEAPCLQPWSGLYRGAVHRVTGLFVYCKRGPVPGCAPCGLAACAWQTRTTCRVFYLPLGYSVLASDSTAKLCGHGVVDVALMRPSRYPDVCRATTPLQRLSSPRKHPRAQLSCREMHFWSSGRHFCCACSMI